MENDFRWSDGHSLVSPQPAAQAGTSFWWEEEVPLGWEGPHELHVECLGWALSGANPKLCRDQGFSKPLEKRSGPGHQHNRNNRCRGSAGNPQALLERGVAEVAVRMKEGVGETRAQP